MKNNFLLGELFCGPGGMALGAKMAEPQNSKNNVAFRISHAWGVDKDPDAVATYNENDLGVGLEGDAIDFTVNESNSIHKTIKDFNKIDALAFGFPCNDFSLVGKQKGFQGSFGNLYRAGIFAIEFANPDWFIAENVSGIHSANSGEAFKKILNELENAGKHGYNLTTHLYKFEDYGIPQYRHRYLIVGIRKDLSKKFLVPAPTHINNHINVKSALETIDFSLLKNTRFTKQSENVIDRLLFTPPWKNAWFLDEIILKSQQERREALKELPWFEEKISHLSDNEIESRIRVCKLNCNSAKMSHIYKRLDSKKPSYTITGSGGGGTHVYHWEECRALTNRERAILQSFPQDFKFMGSKESVRRQIGMAVPPLGAKIIFEAILKTFAGIEYKSISPSYNFDND